MVKTKLNFRFATISTHNVLKWQSILCQNSRLKPCQVKMDKMAAFKWKTAVVSIRDHFLAEYEVSFVVLGLALFV